jgi:hypothetical protein
MSQFSWTLPVYNAVLISLQTDVSGGQSHGATPAPSAAASAGKVLLNHDFESDTTFGLFMDLSRCM